MGEENERVGEEGDGRGGEVLSGAVVVVNVFAGSKDKKFSRCHKRPAYECFVKDMTVFQSLLSHGNLRPNGVARLRRHRSLYLLS